MSPESSQNPAIDSQLAVLTQLLSARWAHGERHKHEKPSDANAWAQMVDLAHKHNIAPLLYGTLISSSSLGSDLSPFFRNAYLLSRATNQSLHIELSRILEGLRNEHMQVIVMNDAALSQVLYDDIGLRPITKLDILVHERDLEKAASRLEAHGYEWMSHTPGSPKMRFPNKVAFTKMSHPQVEIDLRWEPFDTAFHQSTAGSDWYWAHTVPFRNEEALTLGWNAQFLNLCGHFVAHTQWSVETQQHSGRALLWYCDMAELLYHRSTELDWSVVLNKARGLGLLLCIQDGVRTIRALWPQVVSKDLLDRILAAQPTTKEQMRCRVRQWGRKSSVRQFAANLLLHPM